MTNQTISSRAFTPQMNFCAGGEARQIVDLVKSEEHFCYWISRDFAKSVRQLAQNTLKSHGCARLVVIAPFDVSALVKRLSGGGVEVVNVVKAGDGARVADPADPSDMERLCEPFCLDGVPTLVLLLGVLERLFDPRPMLRPLRRLLRAHASNRLIVLGEDRERAFPPEGENPVDAFFRSWTASEIQDAMSKAGLRVESQSWLSTGLLFAKPTPTYVVELSCDEKSYQDFIASMRLPPASDHLVITTEHAKAERTGGIGTYHQLVEEVTGVKRVILFSGALGLPTAFREYTRDRGWVHVADLVVDNKKFDTEPWLHDPESILEATLQLVFLYDGIRLIEFQDYMGVGMRVAQAKRARLLPDAICVTAYAHGTHFYLDHAAGEMSSTRDIRLDAQERLVLELSDVVLFPSQFLCDLYVKEQGLQLRDTKMQAYPIAIDGGEPKVKRRSVSTLVFYGKSTPQKGYPDFCEAVLALFSKPEYAEAAKRIRRLVLMGVEKPDERLVALGLDIVYGSWTRQRAFEILQEESLSAIVAMPYRGDNHPLSIFEVVDANCHLIAFSAGGLPEILPRDLHHRLLCKADALSLADAFAREIGQTAAERSALVADTRRLLSERYRQITLDFVETIGSLKKRGSHDAPRRKAAGRVTAIVPNYNGRAEYLKDAAYGLRQSTVKPEKIIVVDDHSTDEFFDIAKETMSAFAPLDVKLERNARNLGLAGARNAGLAHVETEYVCAHDNDNIALNRCLEAACRILDENPDVAAVTSWLVGFVDGKDWTRFDLSQYRYRPFGQDAGLGVTENVFGDAFAVYRVSSLREMGGWDGTSKALWEDWQLFLRMTLAGQKIVIIPAEMFLYRIRPGSMARTYSKFFGQIRIAETLSKSARADARSLLRAAMTPKAEVQRELEHLRWERGKLQADLAVQRKRIESVLRASRKEIDLLRKQLENKPRDRVSSATVSTAAAPPPAPPPTVQAEPTQSIFGALRDTFAMHEKNADEALIRESEYFDENWYRAAYKDILKREKNCARHYLKHGVADMLDPGPFFSTRHYLTDHADVAKARMNPLIHYIRYGKDENRRVRNSDRALNAQTSA